MPARSEAIPVPGSRVAVVGAGLAGLLTAALLARQYRVTLYEASGDRAGRVVDVTLDGQSCVVDVALPMFCAASPKLKALLASQRVETRDCAATLGVSIDAGRLEWGDPGHRFAQRRLLLSPGYLRLLADVRRFRRHADTLLLDAIVTRYSVNRLLAQAGYGTAFRDGYLRPLAAALWQAPHIDFAGLPAAVLLRRFIDHERLGRRWCSVVTPGWQTVLAGGMDDFRAATPVLAVRREPLGVLIETAGQVDRVDAAVMALKSPQHLLVDADSAETAALAALGFRAASFCLHSDRRLLPRRRAVWSVANWLQRRDGAACLSLDLNRLQALPFRTPLLLSIDPLVAPARMICSVERRLPVLDHAGRQAQAEVDALQGHRATWYAGAWTGDGLAEDAIVSALRIAAAFGTSPDWDR
ncbi:NAD(P)-binding protein [Jeongeupia chitinilytica]|uniref:Amine oxidase domain-containing protein n=1 Tax=Jeongeupia chitinilytica TaxID=1041641 RepID=A0ABQ3GY84_9NEIS|nr:NAD(P)-binding protein [Jeongeupia chitinilytica]GHD58428.1 hypothetical protein GCM10007350_08280 [Jeongeupia chitinilytica]